jgi:hypothetical protein
MVNLHPATDRNPAPTDVVRWRVGFQAGSVIGLPPVLNFGNPKLKEEVVTKVLTGKTVRPPDRLPCFTGTDDNF